MYLPKILKVFFIILLIPYVQAADLNTSLIMADKTVYTGFLEKYKNENPKSDETLLQEALIEKLIASTQIKAKKTDIFPVPKDDKEAKVLLGKWFDVLSNKADLEQTKSSLLDKMTILKNQIENAHANDASLITYQLQYALYAKNKNFLQQEIETFDNEEKQLNGLLQQLPNALVLNQVLLTDSREKLLQGLSLQEKKLNTLQIKKERLTLLDNTKQLDELITQESEEKKIYAQISQELVKTDFMLFCVALQNKDQEAFKWEKELFEQKRDTIGNKELKVLLTDMEREYLGIMHTISGTTVQGVKYTVDSVWKLMTRSLFEINDTPVSIFKILLVLLIFSFGFIIGGIFKRSIRKDRENDNDFTSSSRMIFSNIGYYLILLITFFASLKVLGINFSSLAIVAGALSVGIGFGMQNIVSNFVSGIILMFERSIKIGDYIQLDDNLRGHVTDIRMRSTTINTNANIDVIIPNQHFIQNNVVNWTMNDDIRSFEIPFGVKYGTSPQMVIDIILKAVKESGYKDIYSTRKRQTRVIMTGMGDSSVDFSLYVWIKGKEIVAQRLVLSRFLILIYDALYANNIEIPYPQRDLHIRSVDAEVKFPLETDKKLSDDT